MIIKKSNSGEYCGRGYSEYGGCPGLKLIPCINDKYQPVCTHFLKESGAVQELDVENNIPIPCPECQFSSPQPFRG